MNDKARDAVEQAAQRMAGNEWAQALRSEEVMSDKIRLTVNRADVQAVRDLCPEEGPAASADEILKAVATMLTNVTDVQPVNPNPLVFLFGYYGYKGRRVRVVDISPGSGVMVEHTGTGTKAREWVQRSELSEWSKP